VQSAYIRYSQDPAVRHSAKAAHARANGGAVPTLGELSKILGRQWNLLGEAQRAPYEAAYRADHAERAAAKAKADAGAEKRAAAAARGLAAGSSASRGAFDAHRIAREFLYPQESELTGGGGGGGGGGGSSSASVVAGFVAHCAFSAEARLDAVAKGTYSTTAADGGGGGGGTKQKKKQGLGWLEVQYSSQRRKDVTERVPLFEARHVVAVFAAVMRKSTTRRRRSATSSSHTLNAVAVAHRSPPLFWSAVHAHRSAQVTQGGNGGGAAAAASVTSWNGQALEPEVCFTELVQQAMAACDSEDTDAAVAVGAGAGAGTPGVGVHGPGTPIVLEEEESAE
jgi:hypothetical protein